MSSHLWTKLKQTLEPYLNTTFQHCDFWYSRCRGCFSASFLKKEKDRVSQLSFCSNTSNTHTLSFPVKTLKCIYKNLPVRYHIYEKDASQPPYSLFFGPPKWMLNQTSNLPSKISLPPVILGDNLQQPHMLEKCLIISFIFNCGANHNLILSRY